MPARPATLRDPGTPDQIVMEQHNLTHFPSQPCASNLEDVIHRIEKSRKSMQLCLNFSLTPGTWEMEALCRLRKVPTPRRWTCSMLLREQPNGCVTWCMNAFVYMETKKEFFSCYWTKWQKNVVLKDKTGRFCDKCHRHLHSTWTC